MQGAAQDTVLADTIPINDIKERESGELYVFKMVW
jgi:hypothetical protein